MKGTISLIINGWYTYIHLIRFERVSFGESPRYINVVKANAKGSARESRPFCSIARVDSEKGFLISYRTFLCRIVA